MRATVGHPRRRTTALSRILIGSIVVLVGCTPSPAASTTVPSASAVADATATATSTSAAPTVRPTQRPSVAVASPDPSMLGSTTVAATAAPVGSIPLVMTGPPPVFRPNALTAQAGDVVFYLENTSPAGDPHGVHALAIGRNRTSPIVVSEQVPGGRRAIFTVRGLEAGEYAIWCTFPGHAGLGQVGTLTVE